MIAEERAKNPRRKTKDKPYTVEYKLPIWLWRNELEWFAYGKYSTFEQAEMARKAKALGKIDDTESRIKYNGEVINHPASLASPQPEPLPPASEAA